MENRALSAMDIILYIYAVYNGLLTVVVAQAQNTNKKMELSTEVAAPFLNKSKYYLRAPSAL